MAEREEVSVGVDGECAQEERRRMAERIAVLPAKGGMRRKECMTVLLKEEDSVVIVGL
jgi:hypothetical protein